MPSEHSKSSQEQTEQKPLPAVGKVSHQLHDSMNSYQPIDILMVDDDELDVELFRRALKRNRIANCLTWARDGVEALEILHATGKDKFTRPLIVLLDINMPRMNGLEFLEAIRDDPELRSLTVFVLTTSNDDRDIARAHQQKVAGYIVKSELGDSFTAGIGLLDHYRRFVEQPVNDT